MATGCQTPGYGPAVSPRTCGYCGGGELTNPRALYCSIRCKSAAARERPEVRAKGAAYRRRRYAFPCVACGAEVLRSHGSRYSGVALCGDYGSEGGVSLCRSWYRTGEWPRSDVPWSHPIRSTPVPPDHPSRVPERRVRFVAGRCRHCWEPFIADRQAFANGTVRTCSDWCSRKYHKRLRKARQRGAARSGPYTLAEIAARDRRRCGICRRPVLMTRLVPHPKAPTIDHVVPLSQGGDDVRSNVRLAHFLCNATRGNRGQAEQLAMI